MIGKIVNWTFGSFFRTLGRFLFYIVIGALMFFAFAWFKEVNAAVSPYLDGITFPTNYRVYNLTGADSRSTITFNKNCYSNDSSIHDLCYTTWDGTFATYGYGLNIQTTTSFTSDFYYGVTYYFGSNSNHLYSPEYSSYGVKNSIGAGWNSQTTSNIISYTTNGCLDLGDKYNAHVYGYRYLCTYNQVFQAKTNGFYLWSVFNRQTTGSFYEEDFTFIGYSIALNGSKSITASEVKTALASEFNALSSEISAMQETQQETNEKLDETNEHLGDLNENITSDEIDTSSSDSFFNNFTNEDNGGISGVVTAPLRFIQKMTDKCEPLQVSLFDETIEIPCGDELFWSREDVQTFRNTWNILLGGGIIYALMLQLFKVIQNLKDPDNSKVEVMKL